MIPAWLRCWPAGLQLGQAVRLLPFWLCLVLLGGCFMPEAISDHAETVEERILNNPAIAAAQYKSQGFTIHYQVTGNAKRLQLLWIHGTPGGWSDIAGLMLDPNFLERGRLISIDRPGWGESQRAGEPRMAPSFAEHSELLKPLLLRLQAEHPTVPLIAAGHSWGAPMAAYLGAKHPELVDGVLALAGPFDPNIPILRWYNYAGRLPLVRTVIGASLRNSNIEMFELPREVEAAQTIWGTLHRPITLVHGEDDTLVPIAHADYAQSLFAGTQVHIVRLPSQGHLLQFERTALIGACALALAEGTPQQCRP